MQDYLNEIAEYYKDENSSEHSYRTSFENYLKSIFPRDKGYFTQQDQRAIKGNKPDFIILKNNIPVLYIEVKKVGEDLDKIEKSDQADRYFGYNNFIISDYVNFRFFRNGQRYGEEISLAKIDKKNKDLISDSGNQISLSKTIIDFTLSHKEPIKSGAHLAKIMGGKSRRIRDNVNYFLSKESESNVELQNVYDAIKKMLVHDLSLESFADMYAQTLVYGLFVARYHDDSSDTFSRQEARDLVPASNPFLQHFFDHIAGPNFDRRLSHIVDELCEVFQHANTKKLVEEYMEDADPIIHFYEDFLKEYDPELRKKMGAYYTPLPVVNFIVRSVDQILKRDFGLYNGLADTEKLSNGKHRVQILDPATGTGTFISRTIRVIYENLKNRGQEGSWPAYVHNDLLPRLFGFELMMAPYTIAHLKLSLAFKQTGFWKFHRRLGIYLTNSLDNSENDLFSTSFGFADSIAQEAREASIIKTENPIMIVIGNPPYSGESSNNFESANRLIDKYKFEPGGLVKLKERNPKWLNDDYVKFIAFAEGLIEKNEEGILGYITNHAYLDNPTFRGMRWKLATTFSEIYIIDLHGNAKKKEVSPDGTKDENVFDIMQGVSIIIGVKKKGYIGVANVYHASLYGKRDIKFENLNSEIKYKKIDLDDKYYFFLPKNTNGKEAYDSGFAINEIFNESSAGIITGDDNRFIKFNKEDFNQVINTNSINKYMWRPFDFRFISYDQELIARSRIKVMKHILNQNNISITFTRADQGAKHYSHVFVSNILTDGHLHPGLAYVAPLYINFNGKLCSNINEDIAKEFEKIVGPVIPEDILDYIYAVLHSPSYREKYNEFLKIDFPRVPYPENKGYYEKLVILGKELRLLHLFESSKLNQIITTYPSTLGENVVEKVVYKKSNVYINKDKYFGNISENIWNFYIVGHSL
jgi:predicted helicase